MSRQIKVRVFQNKDNSCSDLIKLICLFQKWLPIAKLASLNSFKIKILLNYQLKNEASQAYVNKLIC